MSLVVVINQDCVPYHKQRALWFHLYKVYYILNMLMEHQGIVCYFSAVALLLYADSSTMAALSCGSIYNMDHTIHVSYQTEFRPR